MLTPNQQKYLSSVPENTSVSVYPWDATGLEIAKELISEIGSVLPNNEVMFIGSLPLKIAGQKDIDLSVLSPADDFPRCQPKLEKKFGKPDKVGATSIGWRFDRQGWEVEIYLTDPLSSELKEQLDVFNTLKANSGLLKEYEKIKLDNANKPYKEYQKKKYEFYNQILGYEKQPYFVICKNFVKEAFIQAGELYTLAHLDRTVYWLKFLRPDADEALCIAAYSHDTERAFRDNKTYNKIKNSDAGFIDNDHLTHHQTQGAEIMAKFLKENSAPQELITRVYMLISKHEVGGNEDQNLLKDADSISYFENQIEHFLSRKIGEVGKDKIKAKFEWMFGRITSETAKKIAKPMYEMAINKLGEIV